MAQRDWQRLLKFRCTGCGNCCRGTVIIVSDVDVRRIVGGTGRPAREFICFVGDEEMTLDKRSPWWIRFDGERAVMALRHRRDDCIFLEGDDCTVYEHRPVTCREHPFNTTISTTGAVEYLSLSRVVPCPHEWDGHQTRRELSALRRWNDRQSDEYLDRVRTWNRRAEGPKTPRAFLRYLGLEG